MYSARRLVTVLVFIGLLGGFTITSLGETVEAWGLDLFRARSAPHPDIVLLAIDQRSIERVGRWPWSRSVHAEIIDRLKDVEPLVVGYDVAFTAAEHPDADAAFARSLREAGFPVVLAAEAVYVRGSREPRRIISPLRDLREVPTVSVGHVNIPLDPDGMARRLPETITMDEHATPPFAVTIAQLLQAAPPRRGSRLVQFVGPAGSFSTYPVSDVLSGSVPQNALRKKIILIGATASDLHDTVLVPPRGNVLAGVEWQANAVDNVLLRRSIPLVPRRLSFALGALVGASLILILPIVRSRTGSFLLAGAALALPLASAAGWHSGVALPYAANLLGVGGISASHVFSRWIVAEAEKRKLRRTFQHYFSPSVLEAILRDPASLRLGGQRREVTILFSDIRSFTTITETLAPERLSRLLHEYFTEMTEEILATDGVVDKFIGDAIMAFWGAPVAQPDHADRAVRAALGMLRRLETLQQKWQREGYPVVDIGIGINTGVVTIGNMGSAKRFDYTAIGDAVNAAARLEGLNKEYHTHIVISDETRQQLTTPVQCRSLGEVQVKGKSVPLKIFSVESVPSPAGLTIS